MTSSCPAPQTVSSGSRRLSTRPAFSSRACSGFLTRTLGERARDLSREFPKPLTTEAVQASDVVITMGCGDACPIFPGKRYLDWELDDPAGQDTATVRRIRDDIDTRVRDLLADLLPATGEPLAPRPVPGG